MAKGKNKDHVSFWFWFFALFVTALPCVGWVMVIVWAFTGQNETRKNYYRAVLAWFVILAGITSALAAFGFWPLIERQVEMWLQGNGNIQHPASHVQHPR